MEDIITIEQVQTNLKNQLQSLYADKSVIEDRIFELKAQIGGFNTCLQLQEKIAEADKAAAKAKEKPRNK